MPNEELHREDKQDMENNMSKRKYRLSLVYMVKDLLVLILKGGLIGAVISNVIMYGFGKESFEIINFLAYSAVGVIIGIMVAFVLKILVGKDPDVSAENAGVTFYNVYAGIHNARVADNAGDAGIAIFVIIFSIIRFLFTFLYSALLIPVSLIYLIAMSIIEMLVNGIPETLGNILDKLVKLASGVGSIALIIFIISLI